MALRCRRGAAPITRPRQRERSHSLRSERPIADVRAGRRGSVSPRRARRLEPRDHADHPTPCRTHRARLLLVLAAGVLAAVAAQGCGDSSSRTTSAPDFEQPGPYPVGQHDDRRCATPRATARSRSRSGIRRCAGARRAAEEGEPVEDFFPPGAERERYAQLLVGVAGPRTVAAARTPRATPSRHVPTRRGRSSCSRTASPARASRASRSPSGSRATASSSPPPTTPVTRVFDATLAAHRRRRCRRVARTSVSS